MLDPERAPAAPSNIRKPAEYLATINLSQVDQWEYPLKTLPRPTGRATRVVITEYDLPRPTTEPHDVLVDRDGTVWYSDFGELFISKFDPEDAQAHRIPGQGVQAGAPGRQSCRSSSTRRGTLWFDTMYPGLARQPRSQDRRDQILPAGARSTTTIACS